MNKPKIRFQGFEGEWEEKKLETIVDSICSGKDHVSEGVFPLYGSTGVIGTVKIPSYKLPLLLVARVGANAGHIQLVQERCGVTDNTLVVTPSKTTPLKYLFYYFQHKKLNKLVYGSGQPLITGGMLKKVLVAYCGERMRSKIISYFTHLDTLITSSASRLASLKQMKSASLQAMFPQEGETKPKIRFKGFEGEWEKVKADAIFKTINERNRPDLPVLSATQDKGMVTRESIGYNVFHDSTNEATYKHIRPGQFVIHLRSFQGGFAHSEIEGICSPAYTIMEFKDKNINNDKYWSYVLTSRTFIKSLELITYGIRDGRSISYDEFKEMYFLVPSVAEQRKIAQYFSSLDKQIALQSQRLEKLKQIKAACLDKMFV